MEKTGKALDVSDLISSQEGNSQITIIKDLNSLQMTNSNILLKNLIAVLCTKGCASICINDMNLEIHANNILICQPHTILEEYKISDDFKGYCIMLSSEYVYKISIISGGNWDMKVFIENNPILSLTDDEAETFIIYYNLIKKKLGNNTGKHQKEVLDSLMGSFIYELFDIIDKFIELTPPTFSSAENIFREFIKALSTSFPKKRDVSYYADALNVTPKYLSAVCKSVCGHTAFEIIGKYVVKDIVYMLKKQEKSIKEIVNELDFPNISFFGKYVKKHLGVPPRKYREILFRKTSDDEGVNDGDETGSTIPNGIL